MNFIIVQSEISQAEFLNFLIAEFPEIRSEVMDEDYEGLIHLQIGCLTSYTNTCIAEGRKKKLVSIFNFFRQTLNKVDHVTENALYVSFLEHLNMEGDSANSIMARSLLSEEHLKIWRELRK